MWFLIRSAFWFTIVLAILPFFDNTAETKLENAPQVEATDAFLAAAGAINYMTKICADRPLVCEKGGEALNAFGYRAKEGALVAYKMIDGQLGETADINVESAETADPITTATIIPIPLDRPENH